MTKPSKKFVAAPWIETRINDVILRREFCTENSDAEQCILNAFWELREINKKWPRTKHIADHLGFSNRTWVAQCMMKLVGRGYLASYLEDGQRRWCDRAEAERLQRIIERSKGA